jgi:flagellar hook-basal body complex protein FliE
MMSAALTRALAAYGAPPPTRPGAGPEAAAGTGFGQLLKAELQGAVRDLELGENASIRAATGRASVQEVVEAVAQAELSLQKITAVRDRVINAYQEIMRMPL